MINKHLSIDCQAVVPSNSGAMNSPRLSCKGRPSWGRAWSSLDFLASRELGSKRCRTVIPPPGISPSDDDGRRQSPEGKGCRLGDGGRQRVVLLGTELVCRVAVVLGSEGLREGCSGGRTERRVGTDHHRPVRHFGIDEIARFVVVLGDAEREH